VRQAIYQAIDIGRLIRDVQKGYGLPAGMLIAPGINGYAPELDQRLSYDPEKAKALLARAGYPDGFSVQLDSVGYSLDSELVAAMLKQIGIKADLVMIDDAEMNRKIASHDTRPLHSTMWLRYARLARDVQTPVPQRCSQQCKCCWLLQSPRR
jgi:peptide/nickel transport system substrate-binding protein